MGIQRPKGTQDIIPGSVEKWHYLEEQIHAICSEYGYKEIRTPIFEATELFQRGVGETTDIVNKEMYTFLDKGERSITLRPEGTASVCRAYSENKLYALQQPVKMYYLGPMFRYENTQAGRFRQFHQFGAEVLGGEDPMVDAEIICLIWELLRRLGLKGLEVQINSVGCPKCRAEHRTRLQEFLHEKKAGLCADCQNRFSKNPMRILDCKNKTCQTLTENAPTTLDTLCEDCSTHFEKVKSYLEIADIRYRINPKMVRGLDYYQKTAFEISAEGIGAQSAICGGGRYDGLVAEIGGPPTPGIGFAMGLERILSVMEKQNIQIDTDPVSPIILAALGDHARKEAFKLMSDFRQAGLPVIMDLLGRGLKNQLKYADREHARYVLIIGDDELAKKVAVVRDMRLGDQQEIAIENIKTFLIENNKISGKEL
ncbi:histidine--tRNA ligase [Dehalobacter sp. DCM]|uniref:histidine--tRNA ligase n=1 Tax=Dehalobacter sp. DCM TaxID=2907827 RepID=UPI00308219A7|nr:histidine--tRNA ligase [Dehalobacter sp. DCM]